MISEDITRDVAEAQVSDDCRVELWVADLRKNRTAMLTPSQARGLADELVRAAGYAEKAADELRHEHEPAAVDLIELMSPDCRAGKHPAGWQDMAWSDALDTEVPCECPCHTEAGAA